MKVVVQISVTIRDVAKAAGVSITTVSRALNGYKDVGDRTKRRILEVAEQLNYRPSAVARSLVMKRTRTIGLLVSELTKDREGHHFLFDVLCGLHDRFAAHGYDVILASTTTARQRLVSYLDFCTERRFDGVVVMGIRLDDPYVHEVVEAALPSVVIDLPLLSKHCGYVMTDNVNGARFAVRHLITNGHRKIAMVNGHKQAAVSGERLRGYRDALQTANLEYDPDLVYDAEFTLNSGYVGLQSILEKHPDVTAVFFASDLMAIGGMNFAAEHGITVPDRLAIVGFDGIDLARFVKPQLSTVAQDRYEMGASAADMLVGMLKGEESPQGRMLAPELIVRESSNRAV